MYEYTVYIDCGLTFQYKDIISLRSKTEKIPKWKLVERFKKVAFQKIKTGPFLIYVVEIRLIYIIRMLFFSQQEHFTGINKYVLILNRNKVQLSVSPLKQLTTMKV